MKRYIRSDLHRYNANIRDVDSADCVKRSISLAFGEPYSEVSAELNRIKRRVNADKFNQFIVFSRYLKSRGCSFGPPLAGNNIVTVDEFCSSHPTGTYLLLTGKNNPGKPAGHSDHMCCVIDGDVYDSWDSRNEAVRQVCVVNQTESNLQQVDAADYWDDVKSAVQAYLDHLNSKSEFMKFSLKPSVEFDQYTIYFGVNIDFDTSKIDKYSRYSNRNSIYNNFVFKVNPKWSDADVAKASKSLCQKIYDWQYMIRKEILDSAEARKIVPHPAFRGSILDLMKCPEWARSLVYQFTDHGPGYGRFEVWMDPLPDDPRGKEEVHFDADDLSELKWQFAKYKKDFGRFYIDY